MISTTPIITKKIPTPVVQWKGSLNRKKENSVTAAIAPDVNMGCATFKGSRVNAAAYNINAMPYRLRPNQRGQLERAAMGSKKDRAFRGGVMATLSNTLAEVFAAMPRININHFIRGSL